MRKQEYIDMGLACKLSFTQIENIICCVCGISRSEFFMCLDISSRYIYEIQQKFYDLQNGTPEEYMLGSANFYGRDFFVDSRVLIPRNDTEVLVKITSQYILKNGNIASSVYADIGTGSACIPVSIISELAPLTFSASYALDISPDALTVAQKNIEKYKISDMKLLESNLCESLFHEKTLTNRALYITANLPYIRDGDTKNMDTSVIKHEPKGALYGGKNTGFELYQKLITQCFQLREIHQLVSIDLFLEIGFDQYEVSKNFLENLGLSFEYFKDSATIYRVVHIHGFNA